MKKNAKITIEITVPFESYDTETDEYVKSRIESFVRDTIFCHIGHVPFEVNGEDCCSEEAIIDFR